MNIIINKVYDKLIGLNYKLKIIILFIIDIIFLYSSIISAYFLKYNNFKISDLDKFILISNLCIFIVLAFISKFYSNYTRYLNFENVIQLIFKLIVFSFLLLFFSLIFYNNPDYSQRLILIQMVFFINFIIFSRIFIYFILNLIGQQSSGYKFYYLGFQSKFNEFTLNFFSNNKSFSGFIVKNIGDKRKFFNKTTYQYKEFINIIKKLNKNKLYFVHSQDKESLSIKKILINKNLFNENNFITLPQLKDYISGKYQISKYKEINFDNLLSRQIKFDKFAISNFVKKKSILITGAGGSIGSEIANQLASYNPKALIFFDHSEYNIFKLQEFIIKKYPKLNSIFIIGSVSSKKDLDLLFKNYKIDLAYHAAAYKHVPLLENENLIKSVINNIIGTHYLISYLVSYNVKDFLFISTDKAVRSKNIMGLTKRIGEILVQSYATKYKRNFNIVRFGNVVGSSGSAINIFYEQIKNNEDITLTNKKATRYFMSIKEAVGLVLESSTFNSQGNIYLLDMGEPIKIIDVIKKMVNLAGLELKDKSNLNGDISLKIIGLRPGEKLYEELLVDPNSFESITKYIYKANDPKLNFNSSQKLLKLIVQNINNQNSQKLKKILKSFAYDDFSQHIKL